MAGLGAPTLNPPEPERSRFSLLAVLSGLAAGACIVGAALYRPGWWPVLGPLEHGCGLAAVLLGGAALVKLGQVAGWWKALAVPMAAAAMLVGTFFLFAPEPANVREAGRRATCKSSLRQIALACAMYAEDAGGGLPDGFGPLYPTYADVHIFMCPSRGLDCARGGQAVKRGDFEDRIIGFAFTPGLHAEMPGDFILAYDRSPDNHRGAGRNVTLLDTRVEWWPAGREAEFQEKLRQQSAAAREWRKARTKKSPPAAADARVFRVLTLNVQKGTPAAKIAADLAAAGADIVCLQELDQGTKRSGGEDQIALLRKALGVSGAYAPSYRDDGGTTGMAILSRFPVEGAAPVTLADSRDIGIRATVKLPGAAVTVFSVHLSATYKFDLAHLAETREMRRRETARLVELIGETRGPVILAGDLNCALDPDLVARFAEHLTDATAGIPGTYPAKAPVAKIDYVFARGLEPVGAELMPEGSSDHRAVRGKLKLPLEPRPAPG